MPPMLDSVAVYPLYIAVHQVQPLMCWLLQELVEVGKGHLPASAVMAATALRWEQLQVAMVRSLADPALLVGEPMDPGTVELRDPTVVTRVSTAKRGLQVVQVVPGSPPQWSLEVSESHLFPREVLGAQVTEEAVVDLNMAPVVQALRTLMRHISMERQSIALRAVLVEQLLVHREAVALQDR